MPRRVSTTTRRPTAWSFSAYKQHKECPRQYRYERVERRPPPGGVKPKSPAQLRGDDVHKSAERYLKAGGRVPKEFASFAHELRALRALKALSEASWTFTEKWDETRWDDWDRAWLRVKLDSGFVASNAAEYRRMVAKLRDPEAEYLHNLSFRDLPDGAIAEVIDFKTGKLYDGYDEQLELYALTAFRKWPDVELVGPTLWFVDQGLQVGGPHATHALPGVVTWYARTQVPAIEKAWRAKAKRVLTDTRYVARPGKQCQWCPYSKEKGGPCEY